MSAMPFPDLNALATHFRSELAPPPPQSPKKFILLYAYNGVGKTRLCTAFKEIGKQTGQPDTLYFNAFTEDLFSWYNDLDGDSERYLKLHASSKFFAGLEELEMDNRIRLTVAALCGLRLSAGRTSGERRRRKADPGGTNCPLLTTAGKSGR